MASKWFKPDPPGTSKPTIRPLNDTLAVTQLPDPAPKPVYVPYIPQQAKNSSSKKTPKFKTSDKNPTNSVGPSVPYMYDLPKIPGNATKTREGYTPKVISDKYPDPLAAYLPPRKPTVYTPPNPFLQLNRFSKKPATATTTAPKPKKLSPVRPSTSHVRDLSEDEQDEILFDTRPSFPVGPPPPVNPVKPRSTFVAPSEFFLGYDRKLVINRRKMELYYNFMHSNLYISKIIHNQSMITKCPANSMRNYPQFPPKTTFKTTQTPSYPTFPDVPDKPVYAIMAKIRDRNLKFEPSNDNHPKTALKRPHQQWEPRWDPPPPRDSRPNYSFPSTSNPEKPSKRKGRSPKKPPRRSRREQGERTQFVPYEPIDADFDTDFHNYMLRQPKYYESDNFNFDFTRRPMPDNWKPDLTVFDCVAAEMERDLEARISGKTRKTTGKKMEFDDLDSYDAHNMFDFSKFSGPADDFEYEPPSRPPQDDEDYCPSPKKKAKKSMKTVEEDEMIVEETEKLPVGLEVPKKRSKMDTTGMKFRSPPPLQPEHRGAAYVKARKIEIPKEEPKMKATIELPKNCKVGFYAPL
ncbi:hypothetical protein CAEBREN_32437 [Caenorhabditis brenneri]|uniref:Uncharacterized protein n=1 Tax=Caenorhabditis brenneri TaxID=135651 RepID=G0PEX5_CAEBE|nr:hypothetical protein CAEBREN_32437 [Caenorhabditis brenneri]